ncbi:putative two-component system response regulator [Parelusimicrobium proximum]|uniref:HD-GYP domain-containing protein n=1 Tax=Parelusimicrobium proximum TaxID=3228953 RepID=UPI003D16EB42
MAREKILIVDDIDVNREILAEILQKDYNIIQAKDGIEAIEKVMHNAHDLSLILLDIMMPEMDGYEVLETLTRSGYTNKIPVIIITASGGNENEVKGLELGAADYITKPFYPESVLRRVESQLELNKHRKHLEKLVNLNVQKVSDMRDSMLEFLASVIEYRDVESGAHVKRTKLMAETLLKGVSDSHKLDKEMATVDLATVSKAVALHDIGKIGIPDNILLKAGKLTEEEFEQIKKHTTIGSEIIDHIEGVKDVTYIEACRDICLYHHERWDGTGYPKGLKGDQIPIAARVMAIVDVYDALTTERVYKAAYTHEQAIEIMKKGDGSQFDPVIFEIFLQKQDEFKKIADSYKDAK